MKMISSVDTFDIDTQAQLSTGSYIKTAIILLLSAMYLEF